MLRYAIGSALVALALGMAGAPVAAAGPAPAAVKLVDINSASRAELSSLPGVDAAQAERIVAGRPYLSKADLAVRNVMPTGVYLSLRHRIVAKQKTTGKA